MDIVYDHTYTAPGTYGGKLRVVDEAGNVEAWKPFVVTVCDLPGNPETPRPFVPVPDLSFALALTGSPPDEFTEKIFKYGCSAESRWDLAMHVDPTPWQQYDGNTGLSASVRYDKDTLIHGDLSISMGYYPPSSYSLTVIVYGRQYAETAALISGGSTSPITGISISMRKSVISVTANVQQWNPAYTDDDGEVIDNCKVRLNRSGGMYKYAQMYSYWGGSKARLSMSLEAYK